MNNINVFNVFTSLDFGGVESRASIINKNNTSTTQQSFVAIGSGGKAAEAIINNNGNVTLLMEKSSIPSLKAIISLYKVFKKKILTLYILEVQRPIFMA